jgi:hypothetical protein
MNDFFSKIFFQTMLQLAEVSKSTLDNMRCSIRKKMKLKRNENLVLEILQL